MTLYMVQLSVKDWRRSLQWYRALLGWTCVLTDDAGRFALLEGDGGRIAIKERAEGHGEESTCCRLVFQVADVDQVAVRLRAEGATINEPTTNDREGYREIRLTSPDGLAITLFSPAP